MNFSRIAAVVAALCTVAPAFAQFQTPNHSVPIGRGGGAQGFNNAAPGAAGLPLKSNGASADPSFGVLGTNAMPTFTGDAGSGGTAGLVPAPPAGSAASSYVLNAGGTWAPPLASIKLPSDFGAVCDGVTDDAVPLQNWLNSLRDGGTGMFTNTQAASGCATSVPLLLQASTNVGPVIGPRFIGTLKLTGLAGLGATATGTGSGTNLTLSAVTGTVNIGDTVTGTGINANTHIISQISGAPKGAGVYQTDFATTAAAAAVIVTSDLLRIWNPTAVSTSQNFYYPVFDTLVLSVPNGASFANCLSVRGYWGSITKVQGNTCHGGDLMQFPNWIGPGGIPDEYESTPYIGDLTCIACSGYVLNNMIGIGASPRIGGVRGTVSNTITTGLGAIRATGDENQVGAIAYTGTGWALTVSAPPAGGGSIQTAAHEVFTQGAGDIDCAQNGVWIAAAEFATISGHRMNIEPANLCGTGFPQWPITAYSIGGGGQRVLGVQINPYITIRPSVSLASSTLFDFNNDANISNVTVNSVISDQTGTLAGAAFSTIYKNINAVATLRIIQNGVVLYDTINSVTFSQLPTCGSNTTGVRMFVRDSTVSTFGSAIAGSGANKVPAYCNGTSWLVG